MPRRLIQVFMVLFVFAAISLPALANPNSSATIKAEFDITSSTNVGSATLAPGHYSVVVEGNQAKFAQDGKSVAQVPCTLEDMSTKARGTTFKVDSHNSLTRIEVSGKMQAIEFTPTTVAGN